MKYLLITFHLIRTGELTRGMLVIEKEAPPNETAVPIVGESDNSNAVVSAGLGLVCITATPGPAALVKDLLSRVWGVTVSDPATEQLV